MTRAETWGAVPYTVANSADAPFAILAKGRTRWALEALMAAGPRGCTPITTPGPRWSAYVHRLREMGVSIETVTEGHGGAFAGHHARYVLRSRVMQGTVVMEGGAP